MMPSPCNSPPPLPPPPDLGGRQADPFASEEAFFDSLSQRWIKVDNFAFNGGHNHFKEEQEAKTQSCHSSKRSPPSSVLILDAETLAADAFQVAAGDDEEAFDKLFSVEAIEVAERIEQHKPKIVEAGGDGGLPRRMLQRRLSDEFGGAANLMPSRAQNNVSEHSSLSSTASKPLFQKNSSLKGRKSSIPRYVRSARAKSFSPSPAPRPEAQPPALDRQRSRSATNLLQDNPDCHRENSLSTGNLLGSFSGSKKRLSLPGSSKKPDFGHVQSKVKAYIAEIKNLPKSRPSSTLPLLPLSQQRKSQSLSNLLLEKSSSSRCSSPSMHSNLSRMRAFISTSHLEDLQTTVSRMRLRGDSQAGSEASLDKLDRTRITRLLDTFSDDEAHEEEEEHDAAPIEVEDVLLLALEERKEKKEAEKVLSQLQSNYDMLQKKYAEAENKIDRLRFGGDTSQKSSETAGGFLSRSHAASVADNTSLLVPSSYMDNISTLLCDTGVGSVHRAHSEASTMSANNTLQRRRCQKMQQQQPFVMSAPEVRAFQAEAKCRMEELQEQLFGLELLTDFSSMERSAAMDEIKRLFQDILKETSVMTGQSDPATLSPRTAATFDPEFLDLVKSVGKKLCDMELEKNSKTRTIPERPQQMVQPNSLTGANAMDPIEKVAKWQQREQQQQQQQRQQQQQQLRNRSHRTPRGTKEEVGLASINTAGATSCYGSLPPSPTPEPGSTGFSSAQACSTPMKATVPPLALPLHPSTSPIPLELDSGYPGSDRSALRLQFSSHKQGSTSSSHSGRQWQARQLSNVDEGEEKSHNHLMAAPPRISEGSDSEGGGDENEEVEGAGGSRVSAEKVQSMHRTYLNSVTDLSSDERSMFDAGEKEQRYPIVPPKYLQQQKMQQQQLKPSPRHPMVLADQIDQEIMELRNFFDDHREEMMTLIKDNSQELIFPPVTTAAMAASVIPVAPLTPRKKQQRLLRSRKSEVEIFPSGDSGTEHELEQRRRDFEKRRKAKKKKELITVTPEFHLGPNVELSARVQQQQAGISAFFPAVETAPPTGPTTPRSHQNFALPSPSSAHHPQHQNQQHLDAIHSADIVVGDENAPVFIPKLALDGLWTDDEQRRQVRDPRSFDFNQSFASMQSSNMGQVLQHPAASPTEEDVVDMRPKTDCRREEQERVNAAEAAKLRSRSVADLQYLASGRGAGGGSTPNVVIVQTCCRHRSCESGRRASATEATAGRATTPTAHTSRTRSKSARRNSKKKSRAKKELKALLSTLEQANEMAKTLRERSKDIVQVLGDELKKGDLEIEKKQ